MNRLLPFGLLAVALVAWEAAARSGRWSPLLFPSLTRIWNELVRFFTRLGKAKFRWTEQVSQAELTARVAHAYPEVGRVQQLIAKRRGVSGRIGPNKCSSQMSTW